MAKIIVYFKSIFPELPNTVRIHLKSISQYHVFIIFIYNLNFLLLNLLTFIPFFSKLIINVNNLIYAYETEIAFAINRNRKEVTLVETSKFESSKAPVEIWDYIVVGSGPGAAAAIGKVASSNKVLILEVGDLPVSTSSNYQSVVTLPSDFKKGGAEFILAKGFPSFAQARVFGGGSEVNSGLYHKLPRRIKKDYLSYLAIEENVWDKNENHINSLLNPIYQDVNPNDSFINRAAKSGDFEVKSIPRWHVINDTTIYHNGMINVLWKNIEFETKVFEKNFSVKSILTSSREYVVVSGVNKVGQRRSFKTKKLILSAGCISTPSLLMANNLLNWQKTTLTWHPMIRVLTRNAPTDLGFLDVDPFQSWDQENRFKFGSAVSTPGLLSFQMEKRIEPEDVKYYRSYYVSFSSSGGGILPVVNRPWYKFSKSDHQNIISSKKMLRDMINKDGTVELIKMSKGLSTVHLYGTMPLGSDIYEKNSSILKIDNRIQVSDASVVPMKLGVNPQAIIMTTIDSLPII
jgi:hypothetical protein